jgi:hypothetical protein
MEEAHELGLVHGRTPVRPPEVGTCAPPALDLQKRTAATAQHGSQARLDLSRIAGGCHGAISTGTRDFREIDNVAFRRLTADRVVRGIVDDNVHEIVAAGGDGQGAHVHQQGSVSVQTENLSPRLCEGDPGRDLRGVPHSAYGEEIAMVPAAFRGAQLEKLA